MMLYFLQHTTEADSVVTKIFCNCYKLQFICIILPKQVGLFMLQSLPLRCMVDYAWFLQQHAAQLRSNTKQMTNMTCND